MVSENAGQQVKYMYSLKYSGKMSYLCYNQKTNFNHLLFMNAHGNVLQGFFFVEIMV